MRRVLAILLALTMMLSLTVSAAWADDPDHARYAGGN